MSDIQQTRIGRLGGHLGKYRGSRTYISKGNCYHSHRLQVVHVAHFQFGCVI